jgi:hypothetical protein
MIRAFIVKIDIVDTTQLAQDAVDIEDALDKQGFNVVSVAPWRGHGQVAPTTPTPQLPPTI